METSGKRSFFEMNEEYESVNIRKVYEFIYENRNDKGLLQNARKNKNVISVIETIKSLDFIAKD